MLGRSHVVAALLAAGASALLPDAEGKLPIQLACVLGPPDIIGMLVQAAPHTANLEWCGSTICHLAALDGNAALLHAVLRAAPEAAFAKDRDGATPVYTAALFGHDQAVRQHKLVDLVVAFSLKRSIG